MSSRCEILLALAFVEIVGRSAEDQEPPQDYFTADGELIGQLLERPVRPVTGAAGRRGKESSPRHLR
jgi:hypothetical protein